MFFVATKDVFCCNKHVLKSNKTLSQQKLYLWQILPMIVNLHFDDSEVKATHQKTDYNTQKRKL